MMKKPLTYCIMFVMLILNFQTTASAKRQPMGETVVKDNMLFIDGNSIPAAQFPNEFVYVNVDDLEYYGFDIHMSLCGQDTDNLKKIYTVTRNETKGIHPKEVPSTAESLNVYTTNAEVYIDSDVPANAFELENGMVFVQSDELAKYGSYDWNASTHQIHINLKNTISTLPFLPFHNVIGVNDINEINSGVIVHNIEKRCADIDYDDLMSWLKVYWDFKYDRVIAPLSAFNISGNYVKFWNKDNSKAYIVYSNGGVIAGKYGKPYESHGEIKQNYVWYLPVISNSRGALNSAYMTLDFTYFHEIAEIKYKGDKQRKFTQNDDIEIPQDNLLIMDGASEWAIPEIEKAAACNLIVYDLADKYTKNISRKEFCNLIYRLIATEFSPNSDSRQGEWFAIDNVISERHLTNKFNSLSFSDCTDDKTKFLSAAGIINGMGDGTFAPDASITREQAATILFRTAEFLGNKTIPTAVKQTYIDERDISYWAKSSVACMNAMKIMNGVSETEFSPKENYTVEQAIATMVRLYECS